MMLDLIDEGPLVYPTVVGEDGQTRPKKYSELAEEQQLQDDCDVQATNIILHGLPPDVYALVNHQEAAKDIWDRVKLLMKGTEISYQERECKLYNLFDKFASVQGETLYEYYCRFYQLINDMHTIGMTMQQVQLYAYLSQHERHANEVRIMRERYPDPLALVANSQTLYNPSQYPQHSVSSMHPSPQQFTPVYATLIHHQLHHTPSNLVAKGFVAITLKCVRSQVQFLLGANNLKWPRQPPENEGLYLVSILKQSTQNILQSKKLSNHSRCCDLDVLSEVPYSDTYLNDMINQDVQEIMYPHIHFEKVVKRRITPDAITEVFNQMKAVVDQCSVDKNTLEIQIKQLRIDNDQLLNQIMSQEIVHIAVNSVNILDVSKSCVDECKKYLELETKLLKKKDLIEKNVYDKLFKSYSTLEKHCISLELATQLNQEIFQKDNSGVNQNAPTFNQLFKINELKAESQEKDTVIRKLKDRIKSLSGKIVWKK
ncbi:hypothetical protein Tco_1505388 [Tanacetum coccineum]